MLALLISAALCDPSGMYCDGNYVAVVERAGRDEWSVCWWTQGKTLSHVGVLRRAEGFSFSEEYHAVDSLAFGTGLGRWTLNPFTGDACAYNTAYRAFGRLP